jgi:hypothetical protein
MRIVNERRQQGEPMTELPHDEKTVSDAMTRSWGNEELESPPPSAPPIRREPVLPRKALFAWALFALAMYFGVRLIGTIVKESSREAIMSGVHERGSKGRGPLTIILPDGKRVIVTKGPNGKIVITKEGPEPPLPPPNAPQSSPVVQNAGVPTPTGVGTKVAPAPAPKR